MLARVSGGRAGIKDYLEHGRKQGREYERDQLDQRVVLAGDLELTDSVIQSIPGDGEKYTHVTLSFREDYVAPEVMAAVVDDFKAFAFSAYAPDEYNFYAEAHDPRIKSYEHAVTGELIERKPHIHMVIPEKNLLSGQHLNPFGKVDQQTAYMEAFQEHVNAKYGFASPKDHARGTMTPESEMIARYKGDLFAQGGEIKAKLLEAVLDRRIENMGDFRALLAEHGEARTRNAGKATAYEHLKPDGADRGLNLRERVFTREFIELPTDVKRSMLAGEAAAHYETARSPRPTSQQIEARLAEWHDVRARQLKYINSGNRGLYREFMGADVDGKRAILAEREAKFYTQHRHDPEKTLEHTHAARCVADLEHDLRAAGRHLSAARGIDRHPERARELIADRRTLRAVETALGRSGRDQGATRERGLERGGPQPGDVAGRYVRDLEQRRSGQRGEMDEIKQHLDGRRLLAHLSHTHGVQPEKYEVVKGKDGADRIRAGDRHLNVSDFVTKELNLPFKEAAPLLRDAYAKQQADLGLEVRQAPRMGLWKEYSQTWRPAQLQQYREHRGEVVERKRADLASSRAETKTQLAKITADRHLSAPERQAARSIAKMEKVQRELAIKECASKELSNLEAEFKKPHAERYRDFLRDKAQDGDLNALKELRRQRGGYEQAHDQQPSMRPDTARTPAREVLLPPDRLSYRVDRLGHVTYRDHAGRDTLRDEGRQVRFLTTDKPTLETGVRLAAEKFGGKLKLEGSDEFKRAVVETVVAKNIAVEFSDPDLEIMKRQRANELAKGRETIARHREVLAHERGGFKDALAASPQARAYTALDREIERGTLTTLNREPVLTASERTLHMALEARAAELDKMGYLERWKDGGARLAPGAAAKLADLELREAGATLDRRYGQYASLDALREMKGVLVEVKDLPSGRFAVVAHPEGGVTLAPAPRNAAALIGKPVHVELAADRHLAERVHTPMQTLVRTKAITERDLGRDRGLSL